MLVMQEGDSLFGGLPIIHITYQQYIANPSAYHDPDVIVHISGFPTAGNLPADYVGYDSNLNMEDIGNIATKAIAKVEPSDTALYLHNVGDGFINKDGNYCLTDAQISVGGTITLGTNCHVVDGGISSNLFKGSISVTGDGTKTYKQLLNELYALIDNTKLSVKSVLKDGTSIMPLTGFASPTLIGFSQSAASATTIYVSNYNLSTNSTFYSSSNNTITDYSNTVVANGRIIELVY